MIPRWLQWRSARELDEEIESHLEAETQDNLDRGMSAEDAHYAALRKLGNTTRLKERAREGDPLARVESIAKDIRYAVRSLRRNPGFTLAAVLSLALAIGVNSAIFSFADGYLLRPLDVPQPSNVVRRPPRPKERIGCPSSNTKPSGTRIIRYPGWWRSSRNISPSSTIRIRPGSCSAIPSAATTFKFWV